MKTSNKYINCPEEIRKVILRFLDYLQNSKSYKKATIKKLKSDINDIL